jgi:hypothetical protein
MGSDLYNHLIRYFTTHLGTLRDVSLADFSCLIPCLTLVTQASDPLQDEALLRYYAGEWDRYTTGANYINRLFTYLNRHWVKREKDEGRKGVYVVYTVRSLSYGLICNTLIQVISLRSCNGNKTSSFIFKQSIPNWLVRFFASSSNSAMEKLSIRVLSEKSWTLSVTIRIILLLREHYLILELSFTGH